MQAAQKFFALPDESKLEVDSARSPYVRGYSKLGNERTVDVVDVREVWEMGPDATALDPLQLADRPAFYRLQGPNLWPADPPDFKGAIGQLFEQLGGVCGELMQAVALALGQPTNYFETFFSDKSTAMKLKCCCYPSAQQAETVDSASVEAESFGVGPHKDVSHNRFSCFLIVAYILKTQTRRRKQSCQ